MSAPKSLYLGSYMSRNSVPLLRIVSSQYNTDVKSNHPSYIKKGTGGRSSFSGIVATVFGSSGFVGRYICNRLGKMGSQLILPYRGDAGEMLRLKLVGDLGQVLFHPFNLKDEESIRKAVRYSNVVINLIGRDWETKNFTFDEVHVEGARRLARISREAGVKTFVHMSSLNASSSPQEFFIDGGSKYLISKYKSEFAVREEFPDAIIFRPSDIYGQEDRFLRYLCGMLRRQVKWIPLYKKGEHTIKQPVFVSDVADGIMNAIKDRDAAGKTFQAVGPKRYLLSELVDWFYRIMRKDEEWGYYRYDLRFDPLFQIRVSMMPLFSLGNPIGNIHWERLERECITDIVDRKMPSLEDLGVTLTEMENQVPWELRMYRAHSYYEEELGEFAAPAPPQTVST